MNLIILPCVVSPSMTKNCMRSLLAQDIGDVRVLAIDNGSQDGVGAYLRTLPLKQVTLLTKLKRVSLNKVWNEALRMAFEDVKLDYALVCNNDTILLPETFRLLRDDRGLFVTGVGTSPEQTLAIGDLSQRRPHPDFSCFLMRRECWERVGKFDEQFHAYCADGSYHLRMHRAGIVACSLQVPFAHIASGTLKQASNEVRDQINREAAEDRETFEKMYGFAVGSDAYYEEFKK